ncbi:hypothetical protein LL626_003604 [Salmonella enterica]|uniref:hypothetical protein n=1 Tax=Citrobacter TaxID=544 RepID=UPI0019000776|nr:MULTISPECIES: hypothetical protein [Citrobacter]EIL6443258.1 hypothetical protein [Salmonella enterica]MBJ8823623.1 hypothetical protein [Citrobacter freundii]MDT7086211.1 hypothetical protein [Citrobacter europaeus]WFX69374.1 hypothetical protein NFK10_10330 [Citrobacter braakii]
MTEAWAAITAGIIAAAAGGIGLVMAKENKTSEFRQAWIQELRAVLTNYSSTLLLINRRVRGGEHSDEADIQKVNMLLCEIHLRINYSNQSSVEIELNKALTHLQDRAFNGGTDFAQTQEQFTKASFAVLKKEWERVKKGELVYRLYMYPCLIISGASIFAGVVYLTKHYEKLWNFIIN